MPHLLKSRRALAWDSLCTWNSYRQVCDWWPNARRVAVFKTDEPLVLHVSSRWEALERKAEMLEESRVHTACVRPKVAV